MRVSLYFVGFFSAAIPGHVQRWRPNEDDPELVSRTEANKRFEYLKKEMLEGRKVDGLRVSSVSMYTEQGDAICSVTRDGTEAKPKPEDAGMFLQTRRMRGAA